MENHRQDITAGQLERAISQGINALYRKLLGHQPGKIVAQLFESKLAIVIENSLSPTEQVLLEHGDDQQEEDLAVKAREKVNEVFQSEVKDLLEEILKVEVQDIMLDSSLDTARTGLIVVLEQPPQVRNPESIPKTGRNAPPPTSPPQVS